MRIFDGTSDTLTEPMNVTLAFGRIESISPAAESPKAQCVDGQGKTLMPGLIDSHAHAGLTNGLPPWAIRLPDLDRQLEMFLASGVTTILVAGAAPDLAQTVIDLKNASPTVFRSSRIVTAPEGHPIPMFKSVLPWPVSAVLISGAVIEVENEGAVPRVLAHELADNPDFIKVVYGNLPPGTPHLSQAVVERLVSDARTHGARVVVHVGSSREAVEAAEAKPALLMHVPWEDELSDDDVARLAASHVPLVTTRNVFGAITEVLTERFTPTALERSFCEGDEGSFAHRPPSLQLAGFDDAFERRLVDYDRNLGVNVKKLAAAGVTLLVGTDCGLPGSFQGASMHREMQSLVALGLKPVDVLRSATSAPAHFLDPSRRFGVIEPGAVADVLLVEGNPLEDITAVEHLAAQWKSGHRVER